MRQITEPIFVRIFSCLEDIQFRELLHDNGFKWLSGINLKNTSYYSHKDLNPVYKIRPDKFVVYNASLATFVYTFTEFKNEYFMNKKSIELTFEQAQKLYKDCNEDMKNLLLTTFTKEELEEDIYPKTWIKCCEKLKNLCYINTSCGITPYNAIVSLIDRNLLPSEEVAKQMLALSQLLICRDAWRNNWKSATYNFFISKANDEIWVNEGYEDRTFSFPTRDIALKFLDTFKDLIKEAGDLI